MGLVRRGRAHGDRRRTCLTSTSSDHVSTNSRSSRAQSRDDESDVIGDPDPRSLEGRAPVARPRSRNRRRTLAAPRRAMARAGRGRRIAGGGRAAGAPRVQRWQCPRPDLAALRQAHWSDPTPPGASRAFSFEGLVADLRQAIRALRASPPSPSSRCSSSHSASAPRRQSSPSSMPWCCVDCRSRMRIVSSRLVSARQPVRADRGK